MKLVATFIFTLILTLQSIGQSFSTGEIIDTVKTKVKDQSYALYLPKEYDGKEKYPIIFFFEPAARARLPLAHYSELADKYGLIMVCSNNSRNYTHPSKSFDAAEAMLYDVLDRFPIDEDLVITSGFSGGSRVAISVASQSNLVKGVIGVGGANPIYPHHRLKDFHKIPYVGIAGARDFNYLEHYDAEKMYGESGVKNIRLIDTHTHKWAPIRDYEIGLVWIMSMLKKDQAETWLDQSLLTDYVDYVRDSVSMFDADRVKGYFQRDFQLALDQVSIDEGILKKELKQLKTAIKSERRMRGQLRDSLQVAFKKTPDRNYNETMEWILSECRNMNRVVQNGAKKNILKNQMYDRVSNMVRASSYEYSEAGIVNKDFNMAVVGIKIWSELINNENWKNWMNARVYGLKGDKEQCLYYFDRLIEDGFKNAQSLQAEPAFDILKDTEQYQSILAAGSE